MDIGPQIRTIECQPIRWWSDDQADGAAAAARHTSRAALEREAILAWRVWHVSADGTPARLASLDGGDRWPVGAPFTARCRTPAAAHIAPSPGCLCGVHGAWRVEDAAAHASPARAGDYVAIGLVALWGRVVECRRGWRASHAAPQRLALLPPPLAAPDEQIAVAFALADYGVPVEIVAGARTAITGRPLPSRVGEDDRLAWPFTSPPRVPGAARERRYRVAA